MIRFCIVLCCVLLAVVPCYGHVSSGSEEPVVEEIDQDPRSLWKRFTTRIRQTWNADGLDVYVPVVTWHNRLTYDSVTKYNEKPWGVGLGKQFVDEDGDSHLLYAMGFSDSNAQFQPIAGYAFLKNLYLDAGRDFAVGAGFTLSITARHEYEYIPLPLPLPVIGIQYKDFAVQAAYVPGGKNDGNVLFAWVRWHFD